MARESYLDFLAEPPAETFADHMVLKWGWTQLPAEEQTASWVYYNNEYTVSVEIDYMEKFVAEAFHELGGTAISRVLEFSGEDAEAFFDDWENKNRFGIYGFEEELTKTACKFLSGQMTDEECKQLLRLR